MLKKLTKHPQLWGVLVLASTAGWVAPSFSAAETAATADTELCAEYCAEVLGPSGVCVGEYQIYADEAECLAVCSGFPADGAEGAVSGNSVQCRTEHALLAQGVEGPEKHCPHAAPGGGGVCIDRSPCEAYCLFYYDRVEEGDCAPVEEWGDSYGSQEQGTGRFTPNPECLKTCAGFAESGAEWEMSGDSANCRMQFFLMAHRREGSDPALKAERASLCRNAHPFDSELCQGYTFGDYYKVRQTSPCKELCYNDQWTCRLFSSPEACLDRCSLYPEMGQRQDTQGDSVQCRLTWAQYAFFVPADSAERRLLCSFSGPNSPVCGNGPPGKGAALPEGLRDVVSGH